MTAKRMPSNAMPIAYWSQADRAASPTGQGTETGPSFTRPRSGVVEATQRTPRSAAPRAPSRPFGRTTSIRMKRVNQTACRSEGSM